MQEIAVKIYNHTNNLEDEGNMMNTFHIGINTLV